MKSAIASQLSSPSPPFARKPLPVVTREEMDRLMPLLTPTERLYLQRLTGARPKWAPESDPQRAAFVSPATELLFGGEPGGGKTALLMILASERHHRAIIFRREYTRMRDLVEQLREMLGGRASYNATEKMFRFHDSGKIIELGALEDEDDKRKYQGIAHDLKAWDELTEFSETQYEFVNTWCRTSRPGQRARIVATANPPTSAEGQWVRRRWAPWLDSMHPRPAASGELRYVARIGGVEQYVEGAEPIDSGEDHFVLPLSRTFVRSRLDDNRFLRDTTYRAHLQALPEPLRSILLKGDWNAPARDDLWQVCPSSWLLGAAAAYPADARDGDALVAIGADVAWGGEDQTALALIQRTASGRLYVAPLVIVPGIETPTGSATAALIMRFWRPGAWVAIDATGNTAAYEACARVSALEPSLVPVIFAEAATGTTRDALMGFANKRAEIWWRVREEIEPGVASVIGLPQDQELLADLSSPRWKAVARGVQIESKEEIRKRIGRSPDRGDAVALALEAAVYATAGAALARDAEMIRSGVLKFNGHN